MLPFNVAFSRLASIATALASSIVDVVRGFRATDSNTCMPHELLITAFFNRLLGGLVTAVLTAIHFPPQDPAHPLADWFVCEFVVVLFIVLFFGLASRRFSVDKPGKVQHVLELGYESSALRPRRLPAMTVRATWRFSARSSSSFFF